MKARPVVVLAMVPAFTAGLWDDGRMARLDSLCEVPDREPLATFDDERAAGLLPRAEILLTGWGCPPLDGAVLERCPKLRAVVHAAGTVKSHITEACWERGLQVSSAAAANALPVAEFTLAAILFSNKRVFRLQRRYRELRKWRHWGALEPDLGNFDKVVGIVGASRVGRRVIELLRPFDFSVVVHDPYLGDSDATALGVKSLELDQLLRTSDVVSLHAPALPETHHLIDGRRLALLRDGTTLINTARGWIVDGDALIAELVSGRIDAVIDTTDPEILPPNSPLYDLPNVLLTPHIAGSMGMEVRRLTDLALDEIDRYISGQPFAHAVQREDLLRIA